MSSRTAAARLDEFRAVVSHEFTPDQVLTTNSDHYAVDGLGPEVVVAPATIGQLQQVLSEAHTARVAVVALGGGAHRGAGNVPESYDVALSLARLDRIIAHEPADLTVTVEPGVRLADLQTRLAQHGQFVPFDPPCDNAATIGGILSANAHGPLRHAYGTARDWLIGVHVVHADGSMSKSGGRVVKNVAGYDMHKLYVGSLGTLGIIAEATLKVAPLPRSEVTLVLTCRSAAQASDLILAAHDAGLALRAAEVLSPPAANAVLGNEAWSVIVRAAGEPGTVTRTRSELHAASTALGAKVDERDTSDVWSAWDVAFRPGVLSLHVSVMPSSVGEAMQVLDRRFAGAGARLSATLTAGVIRANLKPTREARAGALVDAAREVASRFGGGAIVDAAPPVLKHDIDVFGPLRPDFAIMKRLKDEFDPRRVLSPGRFVGRL